MKPRLRLVHCMMEVADLDRAINFYAKVLDFAVVDRHRYKGHNLAYLRSPLSPIEIELVEPISSGRGPIDLDTSWHLGFTADNLEGEFLRLSALGVRLDRVQPYVANGVLQTRFFYLYDPDGHQIEFLEARGRYAEAEADTPDRAGGATP